MNSDNKDVIINDLVKENKLLFEQLNILQEEIEKKIFSNNIYQNNEILKDNITENIKAKSELSKLLIDNIILKHKSNIYKYIHKIEKDNSIKARIGDIVINSSKSFYSIILLPLKLLKIWRILTRVNPVSKFGKDYVNLINTYEKKGKEAVQQLLNSIPTASPMKANAITELARHVRHKDIDYASDLAKQAYEIDPKQYRLKWYAFRKYESGEYIIPYIILDILRDIPMSDWEKNQMSLINKNCMNYCRKKTEEKIEIIINNIIEKSYEFSNNNLNSEQNKIIQTNEETDIKDKIKLLQQETEKLKNINFEQQQEINKYKNEISIKNQENLILKNKSNEEKSNIGNITYKTANIILKILDDYKDDHENLVKLLSIIIDCQNSNNSKL